MTIHERIALVISTLKLNPNSFSVAIGVNSTIIHNIVKGRNAPSYELFNKIALSFDDINMNWLISGNGEVLKVNSDYDVKSGNKFNPGVQPCDKCKMKDDLIDSLRQQVETQSKLINYLEKNRPAEDGQKRKE
ncbi:MAG TPA: hypothetical protein DCR40_18230 [Prolixibacteraceae bacterium]|nr:hypothetical protein [Prolixibacteraceae bacterium]